MKMRLLAGMLSVVMAVTMIPGSIMEKAGVKEKAEAAVALENPRIEADSSMTSGQKVTYDCVWFGSYPQTEIVGTDNYTCLDTSIQEDGDYVVDASTYSALKNASESAWDTNGDITLNGKKYRRLKSSDATFLYGTPDFPSYYKWGSDLNTDNYHFFRYDPIKWRVLNIEGTTALLLADKGLDDQLYHKISEDVTWETSTLRSFLNGFGPDVNSQGIDYSEKNFLNCAFSLAEQEGIIKTDLTNADNIKYGTEGGQNTSDMIYLLSESEAYTDSANTYGFTSYYAYDAARVCKSSTYAKAMGTWSSTIDSYKAQCSWWLRSPGYNTNNAVYVYDDGGVALKGKTVNSGPESLRPALRLDFSSSLIYSYAGTVCSDGIVHEEGGGDVTPSTYSVNYHANGGIGVPQVQTKTRGENLTLSFTEPTRSGYTFMGWGTSSSSTTVKYNKGGIYTSDSSITLYAIWKKTVTLSYNANGGSGAPSAQTGDLYNSDVSTNVIISTANPTRSNYTFLGWSTDSNATSASYTGGNDISISADTTLYAVWQEVPSTGYTITYNANGGNGAPSPQTKETGASITLSKTKPTRNDYEFAGWSTDNTSTDVDFDPGVSYDKDENLILYAIWKKTITLSYNANGGSGGPSAKSATVYNSEIDYTFSISSIEPSRTGYNFLGWGIRSNSEYPTYYSGDEITANTDMMIYAVWAKNDSGGESGGEDPVDPTPQPVTKKTQTITASAKTVPINNAAFDLGAKTSGDGKLTYKSSNTKAAVISSTGKITVKGYGTTTITITAPETSIYKKATKAVTITVVPKKMKLKSVKSLKKGQLQAKWVKDKQADGYQIQFSRDMGFKKGVYQKSISKKLTSLKKPVTGLDSKKKYYIRIRAIKKVSGKKLYGIWSYGKVVKIK